MKIQTLSIISGGATCNARCPFCISQMTGKDVSVTPINKINFNKACRLAQINDVTNVIITGKGEPILYPDQITDFLKSSQTIQFSCSRTSDKRNSFQHAIREIRNLSQEVAPTRSDFYRHFHCSL